MESNDFTVDFNTLVLVIFVIVIILSLRTILIYLFGSNGPLLRNVRSRRDANRPPDELIQETRAYESQRRFWMVIGLISVMWLLYWVDSAAFVQLFSSLWEAFIKVASFLAQGMREVIRRVLQ